ncbi:MAG: DUF2249 domain-containing protein [Deltaproteobacteria bacterium]|nr:DUF2249 domain-containing protein [Deltaproteobacteria bacterium]
MTSARDDRRAQIVDATLALLASTPLDSVSTRQIAKRLKVTQPALFRYFMSRDALILAVIDHARASLEETLQQTLAESGAAPEVILRLGTALARQAEAKPGLPRLLFSEAGSAESALRARLGALTQAPRTIFTALIRQGQQERTVRAGLDAERAGAALVALLQGATLQWQLQGRVTSLPDDVRALFMVALQGLEVPVELPRSPPPELPSRPATAPAEALTQVDARELLRRGIDPLAPILAAVDAVGPSGVVIVTAPFRPRPLLGLLSGRGHGVTDRPGPRGTTLVEIVVGGSPPVADLRALEPPEPLERALAAIRALEPGGVFLARLPRYPALLIPQLGRLPVKWQILELEDESAFLRAVKEPPREA